jgi:hypothetical protein
VSKLTYEQLAQHWEESNKKNGNCVTSHVSGISTITNRIYNKPHTFLDESYDIRHGWYNPTYTNSYLVPHVKEESNNYDIRKSFSTYKNFLKQIINTIVEPLFKGDFDFETPENQLAFSISANNFIKNFNIKLFTMESMKSFYLHDLLYTIVEPRPADETQIDGYIPNVYNVKIENIRSDTKINYTDRFTEIVFRVDKVYVDKDKCIDIPYYTETTYKQDSFVTVTHLYIDKEGKYYSGDNKPKDIDVTRLTLDDNTITDYYYETLPVIEFKAKIDTTRDTTPEMHDLAIECWNYYNTNSLYKEIERKVTFPMVTIQSNSMVDNLTIGVNNALIYPEGMDAPSYLELDTASHEELRAAKDETKQEIYKLFLQGLQTDETKFTSEDSNEISESLFFNKVNFLSEYLKDYTIKLFANVIYVMLDGKTNLDTLLESTKKIDMKFNFDFDMNRELENVEWYKLLSELTENNEDAITRNKLIEAISKKIDITDNEPSQE